MWLTRLAISRPLIIWMALAAIAILGLLAYTRLPADLNPSVDIPTLTVATIYPGAGPEEVESLLTRPLEEAVGSVAGVQDVYSRSQESLSFISVDFKLGTDLDRAAAQMREKVEAARVLLPSDARAPTVARLDINSQPVLYLAFYGAGSIRDLRTAIEDKLKPRLSQVDGVASVNVVGGERREIHVDVDPMKLRQLGLSVSDIAQSVKAANRDVPAGSLRGQKREVGVRALGAFTRLEDIEQASILALTPGASPNGGRGEQRPSAPLTVGEVASVNEGPAPRETITRVNGRESVGVIVTRASSTNTVQVVDGVMQTLDDTKGLLPPGTQLVVSRDDSVLVREALNDVDISLLLGAALAMLVVFLFLHNMRGTIIVAMALPACLVATFIVMYFAGFTLNQMTLLALSLSVGILIDDSIVVLESITRHLGAGEAPDEAAFNGRTEIGFASVAITLVDVVVFLPIAFMGGIVGAFFRQFGLTVVFATLFSLVVSFSVTPALAARWYRQGEDPEAPRGQFERLERAYRALEGMYRRVIGWALANRSFTLFVAVGGLAAVLLFALPHLGAELLPATDQGQLTISVEMPADSSLEATDSAVREVENKIAGMPDIVNFVSTTGEILGGFGAFPQQGPQYAQINVRLRDKAGLIARDTARRRSDEDIAADMRTRLHGIPRARIAVSTVRTIANTGPPIQLQLRGSDLAVLAGAAQKALDEVRQIPRITDPDISFRAGKPEAQVRIDRTKAATYGLPPAAIGGALRDAVEGNTDSSFAERGTQIPIRVRLAGMDRRDSGQLGPIVVGNSPRGVVALEDVASVTMGAGPTAIDRVNGQRSITITAGLASNYPLGTAERDIRERLDKIPMPGVAIQFGGEASTAAENAGYFALAIGMALALVYLVMAALFNSLLNPFIIMFTAPMAMVGAMAGLALTGSTISLVSMIGVVMLTGLMGRNAIILIDYTATLRGRGVARQEAVQEAGAVRLRPILMTTLATIFGMLPVALRIGRASEIRAPMASVVIGGLLVSTVLTLVVIPVLYTLFDDLRARLRSGSSGVQ